MAFFYAATVAQTVYHVSPDGSDRFSGGMDDPFRTISKLNEVKIQPGDSVLFKSGGEYFGEINLARNGKHEKPIYFGKYGDGDLPRIMGGRVITAWTPLKNGIWKADLKETPQYLWIGNQVVTRGRFPDQGYLTGTMPAGRFDSVRWEEEPYIWQSGKPGVQPSGKRYYLEGGIEQLTMAGEWAWANNVLYLKTKGDRPKAVFACFLKTGASRKSQNFEFFTFEGLHFDGQTTAALSLMGWPSKGNRVLDCRFTRQGQEAILYMGRENVITGNEFQDVLGTAVLGSQVAKSMIRSNEFNRIGLVPGYGRRGNLQGGGIVLDNDHDGTGDNMIFNNTFDSIGWSAIRTTVRHTLIYNNEISESVIALGDGGAIYTWGPDCDKTEIRNNKIGRTGTWLGFKVYLDEYTDRVLVDGNELEGSGTAGMLMNSGANNNLIRNNTIRGPGIELVATQHQGTTRNNRIVNNTFRPGPGELVLGLKSSFGTECLLGSYEGNHYFAGGIFGVGWNGKSFSKDRYPCHLLRDGFFLKKEDPSGQVQGKFLFEYFDEGILKRQVIYMGKMDRP